jgi:hypothetical protein
MSSASCDPASIHGDKSGRARKATSDQPVRHCVARKSVEFTVRGTFTAF